MFEITRLISAPTLYVRGLFVQRELLVGHPISYPFDAVLTKDGKRFVGNMFDQFGESKIVAAFRENQFLFTKEYLHRRDQIFYSFDQQEEYWMGYYAGHATGDGLAKCVIIPLSKPMEIITEDEAEKIKEYDLSNMNALISDLRKFFDNPTA